jgi:hypothetical protein
MLSKGKRGNSLHGGSSIGGSEMGDDLMDGQKSAQRISERAKKPVSYNNIVHGTDVVNTNLDYGEVSGAARQL